jgi:diadenylate cyclase
MAAWIIAQSFLPPPSVVRAIDILILGFLLYQLVRMFQGAQTSHFIVWLSALAAFYLVAQWGGLATGAWLLIDIGPYLLLATAILFQAEIRRGLAKVARNPFRAWFSSFEARHFFEDILLAIGRLAAQKTGALIVLERDTPLRTYADSGIPLEARMSYDLLVTIFQPPGPLHDGAVIARKDRIIAAACFLPLSVNPIWGTQLGTRHRAAVGITEETDAVAIVVSEETGTVSLAVGGAIEIGISVERLAERLSKIFGYPRPPATPVPSRTIPLGESHPAGRSLSQRDSA